MNINDAYPSSYLKASDLMGKAVTVTISGCTIEDLGEERKPVLQFSGKEKGLVLNKTNALMISSRYGPETAGWLGKKITIHSEKVPFKGNLVDAIRVQLPSSINIENAVASEPEKGGSEPEFDDVLPF